MRGPLLYGIFCLLVLSTFAYGKYRGLDLVDTAPSQPRSTTSSYTSSGSSFHYVGTSGGYHK